MTHLELENLTSDYLEGLLEPAMKSEVEAHLSACPSCREMVADVRQAMEQCHSAPQLEPAPRLIAKIMLATVGERKPTVAERLAAFFRPAVHPRLAYSLAMAVFSFSIIVNAAGINLRHMTIEDLNPRTWVLRGIRSWNLSVARAEKFIYDAKLVYEIESRVRQLRSQPDEEQEAPKQDPPAGGSSNTILPPMPALAANQPSVSSSEEGIYRRAALHQEIKLNRINFDAVRSQRP